MGVLIAPNGNLVYVGDTFTIEMTMYTDPDRKRLAKNAARYLGKSDIDNIRRPLSIIKKGHVPEIFRGEHVEFEFYDVSKEVYDHIITYTTRDMRVAGGNRALTSDNYTMPSDKIKDRNFVESNVAASMNNYHMLLESGETPQVARSSMPVAAKMNTFVYQFNFLTLGQSVFAQRIWDKGAQGNTVKVVQGMFELCYYMDKELWDTFYKYCGTPMLQWKEVQRKLETKEITLHDLYNELMEMEYHDLKNVNLVDYLVRKFGEIKSMW